MCSSMSCTAVSLLASVVRVAIFGPSQAFTIHSLERASRKSPDRDLRGRHGFKLWVISLWALCTSVSPPRLTSQTFPPGQRHIAFPYEGAIGIGIERRMMAEGCPRAIRQTYILESADCRCPAAPGSQDQIPGQYLRNTSNLQKVELLANSTYV